MNRDQALALVREYIKSEPLINHMLSVEAAMRAYAVRYDENPDTWGIVGLLHDFDWEIHPTLEEHPMKGAPILRERGVDEADIQSILSHAEHSGVPRESKRDLALFAVDELTGLITAVALVRPSKSLLDVTVESVKKKWKDKAFAAGADRDDIQNGTTALGVDLWADHVPLVLSAMQGIAADIGLDGRLATA